MVDEKKDQATKEMDSFERGIVEEHDAAEKLGEPLKEE